MMDLNIRALKDKAAASLDAARFLMGAGHLDFAAARAYYAMFYVAGALLARIGQSYSRTTWLAPPQQLPRFTSVAAGWRKR